MSNLNEKWLSLLQTLEFWWYDQLSLESCTADVILNSFISIGLSEDIFYLPGAGDDNISEGDHNGLQGHPESAGN